MGETAMKYLVPLAAACLLAGPAAAFDNTKCEEFLVGKWAYVDKNDDGSSSTETVVFDAAKTFTYQRVRTSADGQAGEPRTQAGTWTAKPGSAADACLVTIKATDSQGEESEEFKIVDDATFSMDDGDDVYKRQ